MRETRRPSIRIGRVFGGVLAGALVLAAAGGSASASIISFENPPGPGHFVWFGTDETNQRGLQINMDSASQTGAFGGEAQFAQSSNSNAPPTNRSAVRGNDDSGERQLMTRLVGPAPLLEPLAPGTLIGSVTPVGLGWTNLGYIDRVASGGSLLPEGVESLIGLKFALPDGIHYGWVRGVRQNTFDLDALAWAYESSPGVPIAAGAVPEPGSLVLLAVGVGGAVTKRRRRA